MHLEDWSDLRKLWTSYHSNIVRDRSFTTAFAKEIGQEKRHEWPLQLHELIVVMVGPENRPITREVFCDTVERFCEAVNKAKTASDISLSVK